MTKGTGSITKREIVALSKSGRLLDEIFSYDSSLDSEEGLSILVNLHNLKKINLLSLLNEADFENVEPSRFFIGQSLYCSIIPKLDASIDEMTAAVRLLVSKGGADLAANQPNSALREWCRSNLSRARAIIEAARSGDASSLTVALTAANAIDEAIHLTSEGEGEVQLSAVFSLGKMTYPDTKKTIEALDAIVSSLSEENDDILCANALSTALEIGHSNSDVRDRVTHIIEVAASKGEAQTQFVAARGIWSSTGAMNSDSVPILLSMLVSIPNTNNGTVDELDLALKALLDLGFYSEVEIFIGEFLNESEFSLHNLDSFSRSVKHDHKNFFHKLTLIWLLSGNNKLCREISNIISDLEDRDALKDISVDWIKLTPIQCVFIARKAIGYLFVNPISASAIILSLMRHQEQAKEALSQLLLDPILVNYAGKVRDALGELPQTDPAWGPVSDALLSAAKYHESISKVGEIKELHPSEEDRQVDRVRELETAREIRKGAAEKSIFKDIIRSSTLLHGRRSLMYVGLSEDKHPVELELQSHSVLFEMPIMEVLDPVGLDYLLKIFRAEKFQR